MASRWRPLRLDFLVFVEVFYTSTNSVQAATWDDLLKMILSRRLATCTTIDFGILHAK